uniref:F-box/kelch-repeat protein At3g23880-like n=1 Tax=Erigeron canadensis TaxID=72917 RepID=UPI001CB8F4B6|nr:F-box/kelch-repeat protein At3g23880-like [Erigeron canadensis]
MSAYLCEELTDDIFLGLPVKSLIRFRSLSKYWFSHIASPDFIKRHKLRSANTPLKLLVKHYPLDPKFWHSRSRFVYTLLSEDKLSLDYQTALSMDVAERDLPSKDFEVVGSCNGILCVVDKQKIFTLWNPSIRRKLTIPLPQRYTADTRDLRALGFGVDPITDDYKIVMISYSQTDPSVYSMKTNTWSIIDSPTMPLKKVMSRACLVNGTLYWVVECTTTEICIMTFDLSINVCGKIEFPEPWDATTKLMIIKDSLAVLYTECLNEWIWVIEERNNSASWSRVVSSPTCSFYEPVGRVLQLSNGDFLLHKYNLGLTVCNPVRGESSFPCSYISDIIDMEIYAESLVLLDRGVVCRFNPWFLKERYPGGDSGSPNLTLVSQSKSALGISQLLGFVCSQMVTFFTF